MKDRNLPVQVESMIDSLLNRGENLHIRTNYKNRLIDIKHAIDEAVRRYDLEVEATLANTGAFKQTKRR
jgi:hypothetical protein